MMLGYFNMEVNVMLFLKYPSVIFNLRLPGNTIFAIKTRYLKLQARLEIGTLQMAYHFYRCYKKNVGFVKTYV